jgi:3-hexulose-6-phosphate synthase
MKPAKPLIQLALDFLELEPALAVAVRAAPFVDVIEAGVPLCKSEGMRAVRALRALWPEKIILADMKSPDCGGLEAGLAFSAGADWSTVAGAAPLATARAAVVEAGRRGKEILADLTGVKDVVARARELREVGIERVVIHRGIDEELAGETWTPVAGELIDDLAALGLKVSMAGGLSLDRLSQFVGHDPAVLIIGRGITAAPDPAAAALAFAQERDRLWNGSHNGT